MRHPWCHTIRDPRRLGPDWASAISTTPVSSCNPLSDSGNENSRWSLCGLSTASGHDDCNISGGGGDSTRGRAACVLLPGAYHGDGLQTSCIHRPNLSAAPVNVSSRLVLRLGEVG
ncbi:uncharacterized protein LOC122322524 [Drosophila grimshawi]|uniref:uncharacterized protein LOC122322524 n=1 Tax=Drosophila grimshawi TaxID=7222 RepID=UPI001C932A46|nr:uncharacterized protein LOC122322524 [Drosophila grimshawi]